MEGSGWGSDVDNGRNSKFIPNTDRVACRRGVTKKKIDTY